MKKIFTLLLIAFLSANISIKAQNSGWITDITDDAGLDPAEGSRIVICDVNGDDYPDLLWGTGKAGKNHFRLMLNVPNPDTQSDIERIFIDYTEESGIDARRGGKEGPRVIDVASFADVDNDGDPDLVTSIYYHRLEYYTGTNSQGEPKDPGDRSEVMLNDGEGHFTLVENSGINNINIDDRLPEGLINTTGISFLDYDNDGNIDMYFATWFIDYRNNVKMTDVIFHGNGDGTFDMVESNAIQSVTQPMYGVNVTDWNNDGWQDIVTSGYCRSGGSLFKNMKDGTFVDASDEANYDGQMMGGDHGQPLCQWEAQPADYDNDGDMDLLQVSVHGGYNKDEGRTHISVNQGPEQYKYKWELDRIERDAPSYSHLGDQGACWIDLNGDGLQDCAIGQMGYPQANVNGQERLYICLQNENNYLKDISKDLGIFVKYKRAHSMEPADYDLDGDHDLFFSRQVTDTIETDSGDVYDTHMQVCLFRNEIGNTNNWSAIKLHPHEGINGSMIGARVTFCSGDMRQIREIQAGEGHFAGQKPFIPLVGIGDRNRIDSIIIRWPQSDLKTTTLRDVPLNVILEADQQGMKDYLTTWEGNKPLISGVPLVKFDTVSVGEDNTAQFTFSNAGRAPMSINSINMAGGGDVFELIDAPDLPMSLDPGASQTLSVKFTPTRRAWFAGKVKIESDAHNQSEKLIDIKGYGFQPKPIITAGSELVAFDSTYVDSTQIKKLEICNEGEEPLTLTAGSFQCGDDDVAFAIANEQSVFESTLQPGECTELEIAFSPEKEGGYECEMIIASDAYNKPELVVYITGAGKVHRGMIASESDKIDFNKVAMGKSRDSTVVIENYGDGILTIEEISIIFDSRDAFEILTTQQTIEIDPHSSQPIELRFSPEDDKNYSAMLVIESDAGNNDKLKVSLKGEGIDPSSVAGAIAGGELVALEVNPNPFSGNAELKYTINSDKPLDISIKLYNQEGVEIQKITSGAKAPGEYSTRIEACCIPQGAYYVVCTAGGHRFELPLILMR
jgi:hypothetical protein